MCKFVGHPSFDIQIIVKSSISVSGDGAVWRMGAFSRATNETIELLEYAQNFK